MLRAFLIAALAALTLAGSSPARPAGGNPVAFVSAEDVDRVVAVELGTGRVLARIPVARGPHNVASSNDLRFLLVTSPPAGRVTLIDGFTRRVVRSFGGFGSPHDVEFGPGSDALGHSRYAYVTDERRGELAVLDLRRLRVLRRVPVGAGPHDLAVSPDGTRVWVTHGPTARAVTVVDTSRPTRARVAAHVPAPGTHDIAFSRDGLRVWVTFWDSGAVGRLEAASRRLLFRRQVGRLTHHVQVDRITGELWVTDHHSGSTFLVSQATGLPLRTLVGCPGAHHVAFVGAASVIVACHDADALAVYHRRTWRRILVPVGAGPHGVAVAIVP